MINPINFNKINMRGMPAKAQTTDNAPQTSNTMELSGYEAGQAILARNNISFRNIAQPIEVTELYNKKTEGKDHLDLPNIHVYEYPDTNLQVFFNEVPTKKDSVNTVHTSLTLTKHDTSQDSIIKKHLLIEITDKLLKKNNITASVNGDYTNFINIDFDCKISDINNIKVLNQILNNPDITEDILEECKNGLIQYLNSVEYEKNSSEPRIWIDKSMLKPKEEVIKEIQTITLQDIYNYQTQSLNKSEVQYFITANRNTLNRNQKTLYNILNSNVTGKYQKHMNVENPILEPVKYNDDIKIFDDKNDSYLTLHYPINVTSNKDKLIYKYLTLLEIFWREPYISENSDINSYLLPLELKDSHYNPKTLGFLEFSFVPKGTEKIKSTDEAIKTFKALLEILYDEKLAPNTLESIKDYEKELYDEWLNKSDDMPQAHDILKNYKNNVFRIYETIDDIKFKDIQNTIEQTLFNQNPVAIVNEKRTRIKII